jgi:nucleoid-associated protein YgaU
MQAARSTIAGVALTVAATLMAVSMLSDPEAALAADPVRDRAEDLARAASQRFSDVLKGEPAGEPQGKPPGPPRSGDGDDPWGAAHRWLERSSHDYKAIVRRLSQAGGSAPATPPQSAPAAQPEPQATTAPADWFAWSSERFQDIMRKLAEGAAPPHEGSKTAKKAPAEDVPTQPKALPEPALGVAAKPGPATAPAAPAAGLSPSQPSGTGAEERKIAQMRRAEAAKREAEVKKTEEALKAEQQKKLAGDTAAAEPATSDQARRVAEGKKAEDARKAEAARKAAEAKKVADAQRALEARKVADAKAAKAKEEHKAQEARKAEQAKRAADVKKAAAEARQRDAQAKRLAEQKAKTAAERRSAEMDAAQTGQAEQQAKVAQAPSKSEAKKPVDAGNAPEPSNAGEPKAIKSGKAPPSRAKKRTHIGIARAERRRVRAGTQSRTCATAGTSIELPGWYVVKKGDTLWSIAERHYGAGWRYKRIYAANRRHLRSAHWIEPCQRVYLLRAPRPLAWSKGAAYRSANSQVRLSTS